jgi:hypothetical protein
MCDCPPPTSLPPHYSQHWRGMTPTWGGGYYPLPPPPLQSQHFDVGRARPPTTVNIGEWMADPNMESFYHLPPLPTLQLINFPHKYLVTTPNIVEARGGWPHNRSQHYGGMGERGRWPPTAPNMGVVLLSPAAAPLATFGVGQAPNHSLQTLELEEHLKFTPTSKKTHTFFDRIYWRWGGKAYYGAPLSTLPPPPRLLRQ